MSRIRTLLVDDEPLSLELLRARLRDFPYIEVVGAIGEGEAALEAIHSLRPDLLLLDIQMPGRSGLSLARAISDLDIPVVFVTGNPMFAAEAFDLAVVDYVLKPVQPERLEMALSRARRRLAQIRYEASDGAGGPDSEVPSRPTTEAGGASIAPLSETLWVPKRDRSVSIRLDEIDWIEAARDYVLIHTDRQSHMLRTTMETLATQTDGDRFLRVNRSTIVNVTSIETVQEHGKSNVVIVMRGGQAVKVGATYVAQTRPVLKQILAEQLRSGRDRP